MATGKRLALVLIPLLALLLTSCSTTRITGTWKAQEAGPLGGFLVATAVQDQLLRRLYEDKFSTALQNRGVNAVASYRVFPELEKLEKEQLENRVRELGLEGILITRLIETEKIERQRPALEARPYPYSYGYSPFYPFEPFYGFPHHYRSWHPYYNYGYGHTETVRETVFVLETNVYDAETGELVWSARTETITQRRSEEKTEEVVNKIVKKLNQANLI